MKNGWKKYETSAVTTWYDIDFYDGDGEWTGQLNVLKMPRDHTDFPGQWVWYAISMTGDTPIAPLEGVKTLAEAKAVAMALYKMG